MDFFYILLVLFLGAVLPSTAHVNFSESTVTNLTRLNNGDSFTATGSECNPDVCVGLSSGTAAVAEESKEPYSSSCTCQCHRHLPAFREDLQICVDDIHECPLAPFISSSTSQQIPFVYLPLKGQIIHPSKHIQFPGIGEPICAVSGAKFLTSNGWVDLRNPLDTTVPFGLFRDNGRIHLNWEGEAALRQQMVGRILMVSLMCKELDTKLDHNNQEHDVFSRCVAFRIAGTPLKYSNNIKEVVFSPNAQSTDDTDGTGLSVSEIVAIGVCSVLLGLIYVASVFLYLHIRKRRRDAEKKIDARDNRSLSNVEEGIIKNNPLLGLGRHFVPTDNDYSDTTESDVDATPDILQSQDDNRKKSLQITSALVHPYRRDINSYSSIHCVDAYHQDPSTIERLPEENVSIVETLEGREDRPDNVKAMGTTRKKLYFNPAYFEPHLLQTPPPAAIEFLTKIREVITIAKQKMAAKRFTPNLLGIPEEERCYSIETLNDYPQSLTSRRGSVISLKRENSRRKLCSGCLDCQPKDFHALCGKLPEFPSGVACESCSVVSESKQHSIQKWLEDIPLVKSSSTLEERVSGVLPEGGLMSLPVVSSPKRVRSPTRSLPSHPEKIVEKNLEVTLQKTLCPKSPKSVHSHTSQTSQKSSTSSRKRRNPINKPKAPPPPIPVYAQEHHYDSIPSIHAQNLPPPDMIHEALTVEEVTRIPTITKRNMNAVISEFAKNLEQDTRIDPKRIDYDIDSLERSTRNKGFSTPTDYGDVQSSHPSPSLSNALPLDEEMLMQNAIINTKTGAMTISKLNMDLISTEEDDYELIVLKKGTEVLKNRSMYSLPELLQRGNLVSEVYVNNGYNYGSAPSSLSSNCSTLENRPPKVMYDNNKPGHLLIEVEDCPDNYIKVEDSDEFEADTLDRKPSKLVRREIAIDSSDDYTDSLERPQRILLRTTGSFKKEGMLGGIDALEGMDALEGLEKLVGMGTLEGMEMLEGMETLEGMDTLEGGEPLEGIERLGVMERLEVMKRLKAMGTLETMKRLKAMGTLEAIEAIKRLKAMGTLEAGTLEAGTLEAQTLEALKALEATTNFNRSFGSLREIYEAKTKRSFKDAVIPTDGSDCITWRDGLMDDDEGKMLTLEERHCKRQRRSPTSIHVAPGSDNGPISSETVPLETYNVPRNSDNASPRSEKVRSGKISPGSNTVHLGSDKVPLGSENVSLSPGNLPLRSGKISPNFNHVHLNSNHLHLNSNHLHLNSNHVPPDVIPPNKPDDKSLDKLDYKPDDTPIYEHPKPPRKVVNINTDKPPLPPKTLNRKSTKLNTQKDEEYEIPPTKDKQNHQLKTTNNNSILNTLMQSDDVFLKNGINNQFILQAQTITSIPQLHQTPFSKNGGPTWKFNTALAKYLQKPEDSGYLSTDSDESRRKKSGKVGSGGAYSETGTGSETDESFCDGHSESGAESMETHSVFFDSFRKPSCFAGSLDSGMDSDLKMSSLGHVVNDDGASSDSENVSFKTVVTTNRRF